MKGFARLRRFPARIQSSVPRVISTLCILAFLIAPAAQASAEVPACQITPIPVAHAYRSVISADSSAVAIQAGVDFPDRGMAPHVFVYQRQSGQIQQASLSYQDESLYGDDAYGTRTAISADGRLVVFFSDSRGLVPEYSGDMFQLYARDLQLNTTELITKNSSGEAANSAGWTPAISADGRYVAFQSTADNLVEGDTRRDSMDTFVRDRQLGTTERVSIASDGSEGMYDDEYGHSSIDISADGRYVLFNSSNLKDDDGTLRTGVFLRDRQAAKTYWIAFGWFPVMTPDARYIVFQGREAFVPEDESVSDDLYLYDRQTGEFELISVGPNGKSQGDQYYHYDFPSISADGRYVAFSSHNPNIVAGDTNNAADVFVRDRTLGITERLSVNAQGQQGNDSSSNPSISANGIWVTFQSSATNLSPEVDTPGYTYLCQRTAGQFIETRTLYLPLIHTR